MDKAIKLDALAIAAHPDDVEITCGGVAVIEIGAEPPAGVAISPDAAKGILSCCAWAASIRSNGSR